MTDIPRLNSIKSVEDRIDESLQIYRDASQKRVSQEDYKGFRLTRFIGEVWDIVIICQIEGAYTDRYEPFQWEEWTQEGKRVIDVLLQSVEAAKIRLANRSKPTDYDSIPF